jgi:hypothetical protein
MAEELVLTFPRTLLDEIGSFQGQLHFGVVHVCELGDGHVSRGEPCITDLRFLTLDQLRERRDAMETWSQLSLDFVLTSPDMLGPGGGTRVVLPQDPPAGPSR